MPTILKLTAMHNGNAPRDAVWLGVVIAVDATHAYYTSYWARRGYKLNSAQHPMESHTAALRRLSAGVEKEYGHRYTEVDPMDPYYGIASTVDGLLATAPKPKPAPPRPAVPPKTAIVPPKPEPVKAKPAPVLEPHTPPPVVRRARRADF